MTNNDFNNSENKRFTLKHFESTDWAYDNGKSIHTKEMVELLNELHEENKKLKDRYYEQSVEYEGLEEQIESLLDFKDKVFNTINGKIKRGETAIDGGRKIGANVGAMGFHIELLKRLKKELEN